jgi:hypothetical protein
VSGEPRQHGLVPGSSVWPEFPLFVPSLAWSGGLSRGLSAEARQLSPPAPVASVAHRSFDMEDPEVLLTRYLHA